MFPVLSALIRVHLWFQLHRSGLEPPGNLQIFKERMAWSETQAMIAKLHTNMQSQVFSLFFASGPQILSEAW
jgi:hypothetical protein